MTTKEGPLERVYSGYDIIWKAAEYLGSGDDTAFGKVPQLAIVYGTSTADHKKQAKELPDKFFPPLPNHIEDEGPRRQRAPVLIPPNDVGGSRMTVTCAKKY